MRERERKDEAEGEREYGELNRHKGELRAERPL
jgi:hypothetical protein